MTSAERPPAPTASGWPPSPPTGTVLDTWYPGPALGAPTRARPAPSRSASWSWTGARPGLAAWCAATTPAASQVVAVATTIADLSAPPVDAHDVYLRLHLLSHRLVRPHGANLDGIFGLLANVAWTTAGPVRGRRAGRRPRPAAARRPAAS